MTRINENFQFTFRKLFAGGHAFMRLTDEANTAESGIDVVASPPGKKLQNVLLLSGGEKALTALSLLVGIFQYQPSPFCILDEVDAPLDEANVGRFVELVSEMAVQTQFIIITHSKRTMSVAPVMYGVTMQEPGVSKVVSVKFGNETSAAGVSLGKKSGRAKIIFCPPLIFQSSVLQTESKINAVKLTIHAGFTAFVFSQDFSESIVWARLVILLFMWLTKIVEQLE